jgi:bla regulator protein blaR1
MNFIADHLWQSTVFAGIVWLLTLALRRNHARVRHWLWFAASIKFLIPFSLFISLGGHVHWRTAAISAPSSIAIVMDQVSQPFTAPAAPVTAPPAPSPLLAILLSIWASGFIAITCSWWVRWRRIQASVRAGTPAKLNVPIKAMSSPTLLEPGVFGIFRPVLLLPHGIFDRLTPAQLQAVIAHELCHVRHRDNLIATIHMFVETVFWFHPLVWWIGKRMVEERERACDEEVLRTLTEPKAYAEGILNVCKLYVESPLTCVSGVTGANLKKRIEVIMKNRVSQNLTVSKKLLLAAAGMLAVVGSVFIGVVNQTRLMAQSPPASGPKFEAASIKPSNSADRRPFWNPSNIASGGQIAAVNITVKSLIKHAYNIKDFQISGGPGWIGADLFDITAKPEGPTKPEQFQLMLQSLLAERFRFAEHRETKEMAGYALVVAKNGPKFQDAKETDPDIPALNGRTDLPAGNGRMRVFIVRRGRLTTQGSDMPGLAGQLSNILGRKVVDKTGLTGAYDLSLEWAPDEDQVANFQTIGVPEGFGAPPTDWKGPTLFTALEEQLGLKLDSQKGPLEVLVVDHVERPSAN